MIMDVITHLSDFTLVVVSCSDSLQIQIFQCLLTNFEFCTFSLAGVHFLGDGIKRAYEGRVSKPPQYGFTHTILSLGS